MTKKRIDWLKLKQEYLVSEIFDLRSFLISKNLVQEWKSIPGWYRRKTAWWQEEKINFWKEKLQDYKLDEKKQTKLAQALDMSVELFADMLFYYNKKMKEKIQEGQKALYIDELIKFGKLFEAYHKIALWTENDKQEIKHTISLDEEDKKLLELIQNRNKNI